MKKKKQQSKESSGAFTQSPRASARADEARFLERYAPGDFPRPSVTVDIVALSVVDGELRVLLIKRGGHPFKGKWALPGGFVFVGDGHKHQGEGLHEAATRELEEETGLRAKDVYLEQIGAFGEANRDPRMRVITVAYCALIRTDLVPLVRAGGDAHEAVWHNVFTLNTRELAFDHASILAVGIRKVAERIERADIARSLLAKTFTVPEFRHIVSVVTGVVQDPGNFRRRFERMLEDGIVEQAPGKRITASKPALVYRFVEQDAR
jgi:8-oxo-dGTP diphosphatase